MIPRFEGKVDGGLKIYDRKKMIDYLNSLTGKEVEVIIRPKRGVPQPNEVEI